MQSGNIFLVPEEMETRKKVSYKLSVGVRAVWKELLTLWITCRVECISLIFIMSGALHTLDHVLQDCRLGCHVLLAMLP